MVNVLGMVNVLWFVSVVVFRLFDVSVCLWQLKHSKHKGLSRFGHISSTFKSRFFMLGLLIQVLTMEKEREMLGECYAPLGFDLPGSNEFPSRPLYRRPCPA
jgi:hypothetical protein